MRVATSVRVHWRRGGHTAASPATLFSSPPVVRIGTRQKDVVNFRTARARARARTHALIVSTRTEFGQDMCAATPMESSFKG